MIISLLTTNQQASNYYYRPRVISIHTFKILFYLTKRKNSAYFSKIKRYLNRSSSQVSQIMKPLKLKNYIEVINFRPLKYTITELGRKALRQTINEFLKFREKRSNGGKKNTISTSHSSNNNTDIERDWLKYTELKEYYEDILISFFIELPEILLDLNINFTPEKYHRFVEETESFLLKYNIRLS